MEDEILNEEEIIPKLNQEVEREKPEQVPEKEHIRRKIIYVDDVNYGLITVKDRLKKLYEVYPAQSVAKMFELLEKIDPDLILLDVNMPYVDGFEAIKMLKDDARYADIPVIFLSAQRDKETVVRGINLGAVAHVGKPFATPMLIETIEGVFDPNRGDSEMGAEGEADNGKPSILAVDDVSSMLRAIHFALRDKYKVYMLSKPEEVKDFLRVKTPDLFLLDYNMPGMNGFDLIPIIREFPEHAETPIVFLTSEGTIDHLTAAMHLGASDFIIKPFKTKELHEKIDRHLKGE
jgi:DNA-binding response OmpR family regulator